ncbi:MAG: T9SS type A sorting domain-containing protein [Chitinophagales bacterium]
MNKWILLVCSFLITNGLYAQFQTVFQGTYGGANTGDFGESGIETADGNLVFAGTTANLGNGGYDFYLVKTDRDGNELWSNAYGTIANEVAYGVQELADGSLICVGNTDLFLTTPQIYVVKTDVNGNEIWAQTVGDLNTFAADITKTSDGGVVIAGDRNDDPYLLKIDSEGTLQWDNTLGFGAIRGLESVSETTDGGFIVLATATSNVGPEIILIKTDNEGDFEWSSFILEQQEVSRLDARDVIPTLDGGYLAMASVRGGLDAIFLHKTSAEGDSIWSKQYLVDGVNIDPQRIVEMADNSIWIVGEGLMNNTDGGTDVFVLKLDKDGNVLFEQTYSYGGFEGGYDIVATISNDLVIVGTTDSFNGSGNDVLAIRVTSTGETVWQESYGKIGNADFDQAYGVLQTADSGYLIAGHSDSFNERGDLDMYLIKLNEGGEVTWTKTLDFFNGRDVCYNVVPANGLGYALYGSSENEEGLSISQLTRIDEDGNVMWTHRFENLLPVFTKGISALADGGFVICGRLSAGGVYYAKLNSDGDIVWENSYVGNVAYNIKPTSDGGYVLAGRGNFLQDSETNAFYTPLQVVKTDENGEVVWEYIAGSGLNLLSRAFDVIETISGGFVLIGARTGESSDDSNLLIAKLSDTGSLIWEKELLLNDYSFNNYVVQQTSDNGLMFVGNVGDSGDPSRRGFLLKTDGIGNQKWIRYLGEDVGTFPTLYGALQTNDGGYATVGSIVVNNSVDMYFVKADELGFTEIVGIFSPTVRLLLQLAPNPSNGRFQMTFEGEQIGVVDVHIFDTAGRKVFDHSGYKNSHIYQQELDISDLNSGIYVIEVISGDKRYSQQLILK